jgi:hypothetical protein
MLKISDKELLDIVQIIAAIYYKGPDKFEFSGDSDIKQCFLGVLFQRGYTGSMKDGLTKV